MYFFDKKVIYLVWKMHEGQARGVGTVRLMAMDDVCRIEVTITGCGRVQGTYPVYAVSGDLKSLLGKIILNKGKGNLYLKCKTNAIGHMAFPYGQVTGLHIDLKTEGCLEQKWLPMASQLKESENPVQRIPKLKEDEMPEQPVIQMEENKKVIQREIVKEKAPVEPEKPPKKKEFQLYPNKWKQLCAIYPIVHPFGDGRAYLSIEPRDFVVLQERYQPMVQNSFLLHGFYYYKHLLLGRHRQGKNIQYYLGVPGVFYEKEKAAALFYGFESFEGAVTPASEGSFGYYMKRVEI
ncbi:MAG: hypothetical protein J6A45_06080 [Lachnospiraceae bacterium]|nr:hypothetical protein [Lachnospiraceae bacterium]